MSGTLYLVGVGPGDPELLTLKAARILGAASVVAFAKTESGRTMALDIARDHISASALLEPISIPMTVRLPNGEFASKEVHYMAAAAIIEGHLLADRDVVYLCEGDPLFYGTSIYVGTGLWDRFPVKVIPGITSMNAAAAAIPFPLVARFEPLTVLTGPSPDEVLLSSIDAAGSVVILKVGRHYDRLVSLLERTERAEWAWLVENVGGESQRIIRVRDAEPGPKPYFSLLLCYSGAEFWLQ
jgi:precorrin-2/cobalt-factor-2 C20-methyltransferase